MNGLTKAIKLYSQHARTVSEKHPSPLKRRIKRTMQKGNARHFSGTFIRVSGSHEGLLGMLNKLENISGAEVIDCFDTDQGTSELQIQARAFARTKILTMAKARGLEAHT